MHRIDSATARANANGEGKTGFSDNGDLPNQDATYFTPEWANSLQEEVAGAIEGLGITLDKADNGQLLAALVQSFAKKKLLEDSIQEYKDMIKEDRERLESLENRTYEDTQIGELFWTVEHFDTPEQVVVYKGYGTWERALQGRVAVGFSDNPGDDVRFRTPNAEYGESEHTLTIAEMPSHSHDISLGSSGSSASFDNGSSSGGVLASRKTGGGEPHNNLQPSTTLDCWKRVA